MVPTELSTQWGSTPHRISRMETTSRTNLEAGTIDITGQNDGGEFGFVDTAWLQQAFDIWQAPALSSIEGSVLVEIGPGGENASEASVTVDGLSDVDAAIAFLRGYRVDTDLYDNPPEFATSIPYAPALGYTSQGLGLALDPPTRDGDGWKVTAKARNQLGISDRADMNAAIPLATTWVRVDFVLVGARDPQATTARGAVSYPLSFAEYNTKQGHPNAREELQDTNFEVRAGAEHALFGMTAFDAWVNVAGRGEESCVVVQDEINFWGEMVSGPGRYLTELSARLWDTSYDGDLGQAHARLDILFSNRSTLKEVGNLCMELRGEAGVLLFDGDATRRQTGLVETDLDLPTEAGGDAPVTSASVDLNDWL